MYEPTDGQRLFPIVADTEEPLADDMASALMLLEVAHMSAPGVTLSDAEVRDFIRGTPYAHVADDFRDYFLLWED